MSQDPAVPEVSARVKTKFGPCDVRRYDSLLHASVGAADLGQVHVDCKFLFKKSRWGTLDNRKAGIIYLDLTFSQPGDCRLSSASIMVTLDDEDKDLAQFAQNLPSDTAMPGLHIREYGPREMLGHPRYEMVTTHNKITPEVEIGSIAGAGGIGHESVKKTVRDCWWKFEGHLKASENTKTGTYNVLQWHVTENELQTQPLHSNTVHTAFSFDHGGQPFFMHVEVSGKLKNKASDIRQKIRRKVKSMKFPRSSRCTTTLIHFKKSHLFTRPLDEYEKRLAEDMRDCNMIQPVVIPEAQGQITPESPPALDKQPSTRPHIEEYQLIPEEKYPEVPTIDEFASLSKKVLEPFLTPDVSTSGAYNDDEQGEKPLNEAPGLGDLQRQIVAEKVDLSIFMLLMKVWVAQLIGTLLGYGANGTSR